MAPRTLHFVGNTSNNTTVRDELITAIELDFAVVEIPKGTFSGLRKLVQVTLRADDGSRVHGKKDTNKATIKDKGKLKVIDAEAFWDCPHLKHVSFPVGIERIEAWAFGNCPKLQPPQLSDSLVHIGPFAFCGCNFRHLRIPASITCLSNRMLEYCTKLYSIEVPPTLVVNEKDTTTFYGCERLRNIAFPKLLQEEASQDGDISVRPWCHGCNDLLQVNPDPDELTMALAHRFDGLPIHRICYYHSYCYQEGDTTGKNILTNLKEEWTFARTSAASRSPLDFSISLDRDTESPSPTTYRRQDFLGMTPLHILALSTTPRPDLMVAIIELDPVQLVIFDFWESLPIYYACESWKSTSSDDDDSSSIDVIRLLLQHHVTKFPSTKLDWTKLVTATGHLELAKLLLSEARSILDNIPTRLL